MSIPIAKPYFDEYEKQAVSEVLESGWVSQGPKCEEFERAVRRFVGAKHAVATNSGTSAIHLALIASEVGPGDEVICPAFTCVAMLHPIEHLGAKPVLVDIELEAFGLDVSLLADAMTSRTRAVMAAHLFGLAANMEEIARSASDHGISMVEDAALGLGATLGNKNAGSFGDVSCLSFHPRKMITTGEGGMILTDSEEIARRAAELRNYGATASAWTRHEGNLFDLADYKEAGFNYKLTDIQAAIGLVQIKKLTEILRKRCAIARRYDEAFADLDWLILPREPEGRRHAYQSYVCMVSVGSAGDTGSVSSVRRKLWSHLAGDGIASVQGAQAMPTVAYYHEKYGWEPRDFPAALRADVASVALPIFPGLTEDEQDRVIRSVQAFRP